MAYKLTLDGGLLDAKVLLPAVRTLKEWQNDGKVELFRADRASGVPAIPSPAPMGGRSRAHPRKIDSGGVSFARVSGVLYPHRDTHRLSMSEINDVTHLMVHHTTKHPIFVTTNQNFIDRGKREHLKVAFQIVVMTPQEVVTMLEEPVFGNDTPPSPKTRGAHES